MSYLAACETSSIHFYDSDNYQEKSVYVPFKEKDNEIKSVKVSEDGSFFAILPKSGFIQIGSVKGEGINKHHIIRSFPSPLAMSFHKMTRRNVCVASDKGEIAIYDLKIKNVHKHLNKLNARITHLDTNFKDSHMAAGTDDGAVYIYNLVTSTRIKCDVVSRKHKLTAMSFHKENNFLLGVGDEYGGVVVSDINMSKPKLSISEAHAAPCSGLVFSPVNTTLVSTVGYDCSFNAYDLTSNKCVISKILPNPLSCIAITHTGNVISVGSRNGAVYIIDLRNINQILHTISIGNEAINSVIFRTKSRQYSTPLSFEFASTASNTSIHSARSLLDDSFLAMLTSPIDEVPKLQLTPTNVAGGDSGADSFLKAMGITQPQYELDTLNQNLSLPTESIYIKTQLMSENITNEISPAPQRIDSESENENELDNQVPSNFKLSSVMTETGEINSNRLLIQKDAVTQTENAYEMQNTSSLTTLLQDQMTMNAAFRDKMECFMEDMYKNDLGSKMLIVKQFYLQEKKMQELHDNMIRQMNELRLQVEDLKNEFMRPFHTDK